MNLKIIKNIHGSAQKACDKWLSGSLYGHPIILSENNIHIYGAYKGNWTPVNVGFTKDKIVIMRSANEP